ncbi:MAG: hypothetical protein ABSC23_01395 [Bryobacteraceae bacterium]|jgi:hypothetical protein
MTAVPDSKTVSLRHALATLAYRGAKALRAAPPEFAAFRAAPVSRTPVEILAHMGDLLDWTLAMANGKFDWRESTPLPWDQETARFFAALEALDRRLAAEEPIEAPAEKLFQGPIADALTHVGQIAMLRNIAGAPMRGENYFVADIAAGRVGLEQHPPRREF